MPRHVVSEFVRVVNFLVLADTLAAPRPPMSFRKRLTSFFVLIVILPMIAVGGLVFRLIADSRQAKTDARTSGLSSAAASSYLQEIAVAQADARTLARQLSNASSAGPLSARLSALLPQSGLVRVVVRLGSRTLADVGDRGAIAPGTAEVRTPQGSSLSVSASTVTATDYVASFARAAGVGVAVTRGSHLLASTLPLPSTTSFPNAGTFTVGRIDYRVVTQKLPDFAGSTITVTVLSDPASSGGSTTGSRAVAAAIILSFLLLAVAFALVASRALEGQVRRFLEATRRLGGGDFSSPVPIEGGDEFAALGEEFNRMSTQLDERLRQLSAERARLRGSFTRIGESFAANLDPQALARLALHTAVDAMDANGGRITIRSRADAPLSEAAREGSLTGLEDKVLEAERRAVRGEDAVELEGESHVMAVRLGRIEQDGAVRGVITITRPGEPFSDGDSALLRSLASQTGLALENVDLHFQIHRQAVTDELTGLANHGRFQERLSKEFEQVRGHGHPLGLIMLDIDDFKLVNDTFGHQQGDLVLKQVAMALRASSRQADTAARYGGEEMALILPNTDLEGSYAIAERLREAIQSLRVGRLDGGEPLRVTASLGVAATSEGEKHELIACADKALYRAKRRGKNRASRGQPRAANVAVGE